ncbi:MAG: hypothetical protein J7L79_02675 [Thaumarchaeota archaeon]|nr:hypothetical protein [Nitrososphaerota archaeon]
MNKAAVDLLKALLLMYGSAWESELKDMLMTIWSVRGLDLEEMGRMQKAVEEAEEMLQKAGLITVEEKERGDLGRREPIKEKLYELQNLFQVMKLLGGDPELDKIRLQLQGQL